MRSSIPLLPLVGRPWPDRLDRALHAHDGHHPLEFLDLFAGLPHIDSMPVGLMTLGFAREDRPHAYIVSTTAFLAEDDAWPIVRDNNACRRTWAELKATVAAIEAEAAWPPEPGTRCLFCPYFRDGCALDRLGGEAGTADWLDEATGDAANGDPVA